MTYGTNPGTHRQNLREKVLMMNPAAGSVYRFVVAGLAAGIAVKKAVGAEAHGEFGLAEHAVFFAPATRFRPLALGADDSAYAWFRRHGRSLVRPMQRRNVTEVTEEQVSGVRSQVPGRASPRFGYWSLFLVFLRPDT